MWLWTKQKDWEAVPAGLIHTTEAHLPSVRPKGFNDPPFRRLPPPTSGGWPPPPDMLTQRRPIVTFDPLLWLRAAGHGPGGFGSCVRL